MNIHADLQKWFIIASTTTETSTSQLVNATRHQFRMLLIITFALISFAKCKFFFVVICFNSHSFTLNNLMDKCWHCLMDANTRVGGNCRKLACSRRWWWWWWWLYMCFMPCRATNYCLVHGIFFASFFCFTFYTFKRNSNYFFGIFFVLFFSRTHNVPIKWVKKMKEGRISKRRFQQNWAFKWNTKKNWLAWAHFGIILNAKAVII